MKYQAIYRAAILLPTAVFGLLVLAATGYLDELSIGDLSLWPIAILAATVSVFVAAWAYAKSKGRSGWWGVLAPFLDVFGLKLLQRLERRDAGR